MHPLILAALIGGTTGGLSAKARGTDPMKGILSGAVTGAATSGLGSLIGPAATSGTEIAAQEAIKKKVLEDNMLKKQHARIKHSIITGSKINLVTNFH